MDGESAQSFYSFVESQTAQEYQICQVKAQIALLQGIFQKPWDYKVFCDEGVLFHAAALSSMEPKKVRFSTMTGKHVNLFIRVKVVPKIVSESAPTSTATPPSIDGRQVFDGPTPALKKRPLDSATSARPVFAKRTKTLPHTPQRPKNLDLTNEPLQ
ncbi:hypothetical protein LIER_32853 [Lithospermum erythrorhizon]|uniref:Uncharacterized protein n=1 Tax=Lithospermum erythrorhizon TaxID=34254 RepID=A0AAV3RY55_LITER